MNPLYKYAILAFLFFGLFNPVVGQQQRKGKKVKTLQIESRVVDENGRAVNNALVTVGEGMVQTYTDATGSFTIKCKVDNVLVITAMGYEDRIIDLGVGTMPPEIRLSAAYAFDSQHDLIDLPANTVSTQRQLVGAVGRISGDELRSQPDLNLSNALQGRLSGLTVRMNAGGLGNATSSLTVRGLAREGGNDALTVVDGIERPLDFLMAEEIESIEVLKDASSKILYGPRAANGVIFVTTKKGKPNTKVIKASAEYGMTMSTRMPEYLGSAEYATLYNEARQNDGLPPLYSSNQIEGYRQSTGENDLLFPDADYVDYFLRNVNPFRKANLEYAGGNQDVRYAFMGGYIGTEGMEKIGETPKQDRFNIRGNLDIKITGALSAFIGGNGIIETRKWGKLDMGSVFTAISSHRPNEYPFVIHDPNFTGEGAELGQEWIPPLGGSYIRPRSLYGDMVYGGMQEYQFFYGQTNFGLDLSMDKILTGLSAKGLFTFDNYQYQSQNQINNPIRYGVIPGEAGNEYVQLQNRVISGNRSEQDDNISRNTGWMASLNYERTFSRHAISTNLSHFYYLNEDSDRRQHVENTNTFLRAVYGFDRKLYIEATGAIMGSNRFAAHHRFQFFPSIGAAWILSSEDFMKGSSIDFLKVKGSFGILGYDRATSFYLYDTRYSNNGNVQFNERNQRNEKRISFDNFGNPDLQWEISREFNLGVEGYMLNNSLGFEANYFNEFRDRIIVDNPGSMYSTINGTRNIPLNLGQVANQGIEASVNYFKTIGKFSWRVGGNLMYVKNKVKKTDEVNYPDTYLRQIGRPSDAIFGWESNGIIRDENQLANGPKQVMGRYGIGNLAYQDLNKDGVVDELDQRMIGNSFPRTTLGINVYLNYKGFGLFMLGTSELGVHTLRDNSYYWSQGEDKYSVFVRNRFHPVNNPMGSLPALTTFAAQNDFRASTFWMEDASFFRLKNIELSYTIANTAWTVKQLKFFARASNVLVISAIKELDPEALNAGVDRYPIFRTLTGGLTFSF